MPVTTGIAIAEFALKVLELLPSAARGVESAVQAMQVGQAKVKQMVAEARDPSEAEWATLNSQVDGLMAALRSAASGPADMTPSLASPNGTPVVKPVTAAAAPTKAKK
jgi:hypothetical protein